MARPKIQDVAKLAGVALSTVSAVLNAKNIVSDGTRQRVLEAIEKLEYRPDFYASNLARRQTNVFGLIVSSLLDPFFAETAQAIESEARLHGIEVSLVATNFSPELLRGAVRQMLDARVAGIAVMTSEYDQQAYEMITENGIASVFLDVGRPSDLSTNIHVDTRGGMIAAVEHLIALGHRDLLLVHNSIEGGSQPLLSHRYRNQGFSAAIQSSGVEGMRSHVVSVPGPETSAGLEAMRSSIGNIPFTAVITTTDLVAMGVYRGLNEHGLRIPEDISVVGFDNTYISEFFSPPLTTIDIPRTELSRLTIKALLAHLKHAKVAKSIQLATKLVVRSSTAAPVT